ncbi:MAG: type II secretion system protein [Methylococcales bacterium]|nr:type II secretion system protein [Methylococcales bacterium]
MNRTLPKHKISGFTLMELVLVIVLTGIMSGISIKFVSGAVDHLLDVTRRAQLVDVATLSLRMMSEELRLALPNSVRIGCANQCLEFLLIKNSGNYRATAIGGNDDALDIGLSDNRFDVIGALFDADQITFGNNATDCQNGLADCLYVNNAGNPYVASILVTLTGCTNHLNQVSPFYCSQPNAINGSFPSTPIQLLFSNKVFPTASVTQSFYVVDTAIQYRCTPNTVTPQSGILQRYSNYPITQTMATVLPPANSQVVLFAEYITACTFSVTAGAGANLGLVTLELTVSNSNGDSIKQLQQVRVVNQP